MVDSKLGLHFCLHLSSTKEIQHVQDNSQPSFNFFNSVNEGITNQSPKFKNPIYLLLASFFPGPTCTKPFHFHCYHLYLVSLNLIICPQVYCNSLIHSFLEYLLHVCHVTVVGIRDSAVKRTDIISLLEFTIQWEQIVVEEGIISVPNIMKGKCRLSHEQFDRQTQQSGRVGSEQ